MALPFIYGLIQKRWQNKSKGGGPQITLTKSYEIGDMKDSGGIQVMELATKEEKDPPSGIKG